MNKQIQLGSKIVGDGLEPYLIAEIGINHNGDMGIAKKLIDAAYVTGWDAVKLQKRNPDISIPEHQKGIMRETPWGSMSYLDYKKRIEFDDSDHFRLGAYSLGRPIDYSLSIWDLDSIDIASHMVLPWIKIPSAHLTNSDLLLKACRYDIPIILSTGMSVVEEIDIAVNILKRNCNANFILMHTNSAYPSRNCDLNLRCIPWLRDRYDCLVGYSGHEVDLEPSVIAVSMGACVIERHITLSHDMWGTDQKASLEVHAADMLVKRIRAVRECMGDGVKRVTASEIEVRRKLRGV